MTDADLTSTRATNEDVIAAYRETGSVWKAAARLGTSGQSVWERLRAIGYPMASRKWTPEEVDELRRLVPNQSAASIAQQLGRPFAGVACKMNELGLYTRRKQQRGLYPALTRGSGITRDVVKAWAREVVQWKGSLRQFAIARGVRLETIVQGLQRHYPNVWQQVAPKLDTPPIPCPECGREFVPATKKQKTCSRVCTNAQRVDQSYFGGKRKQTIGLAEGVCQMCMRSIGRGLSSHHLIGKENDPDNELLVALCQGCHQLVGRLASRTFVDTEAGWERLMEFVLLRRFAEHREHAGFHVAVDIDWLNEDDIPEEGS
jgi:hypothetical protein